jgi:hypothetical protein
MEKEKDRRRDLLVAEIKSAGFGAMQDINKNNQSDYMDALGQIQQSSEFQETMSMHRVKEDNKVMNNNEKINLAKQKLSAEMEMKQMDVQIAKENKNKYDNKSNNKKKK